MSNKMNTYIIMKSSPWNGKCPHRIIKGERKYVNKYINYLNERATENAYWVEKVPYIEVNEFTEYPIQKSQRKE